MRCLRHWATGLVPRRRCGQLERAPVNAWRTLGVVPGRRTTHFSTGGAKEGGDPQEQVPPLSAPPGPPPGPPETEGERPGAGVSPWVVDEDEDDGVPRKPFSIDASGLGRQGYRADDGEASPSSSSSQTRKRPATPLGAELADQIKTRGPVTAHEFMRQCLLHPKYGYYARAGAERAFGLEGDFITAPELSQLFGELLGVWLVDAWRARGKPPRVRLVELGPGRGVLMADVLRATSAWPDFRRACVEVHMVEPSASLREAQQRQLRVQPVEDEEDNENMVDAAAAGVAAARDLLAPTPPLKSGGDASSSPTTHPGGDDGLVDAPADYFEDVDGAHRVAWALPDDFGARVRWHESLATVSVDGPPCFFLAQEVLDAFPAHQFVLTESGWREKLVDVEDDPGSAERFRWVLAPTATVASSALILSATGLQELDARARRWDDEVLGFTAEVAPGALAVVDDVAKRVASSGGAALFVDYGKLGCLGDTMRGFRRHEQVSPLVDPGIVDLTVDADFAACGRQAALVGSALPGEEQRSAACAAFGPVDQGEFLGRMGIVDRLQALLASDAVSDEAVDTLISACERLCAPEHMGTRYKVLALAGDLGPEATTGAAATPGDGADAQARRGPAASSGAAAAASQDDAGATPPRLIEPPAGFQPSDRVEPPDDPRRVVAP